MVGNANQLVDLLVLPSHYHYQQWRLIIVIIWQIVYLYFDLLTEVRTLPYRYDDLTIVIIRSLICKRVSVWIVEYFFSFFSGAFYQSHIIIIFKLNSIIQKLLMYEIFSSISCYKEVIQNDGLAFSLLISELKNVLTFD